MSDGAILTNDADRIAVSAAAGTNDDAALEPNELTAVVERVEVASAAQTRQFSGGDVTHVRIG